MENNELRISNDQFAIVTKRFRGYRVSKRSPRALIAFRNDYASFEVEGGEVVAVHAKGEWHGAASIPAFYLGALHKAPPSEDPVLIRYTNGKLKISTLLIGCEWVRVGEKQIRAAESPSTLDLLTLERTVSRAEIHGTSLGKKISQAKRVASAAVTRAANSLSIFGIARQEIEAMVEKRIHDRVGQG